MTVQPMAEILTQPERRRRWTSEQKLALVAEMLRPGASPTQVARRYGISTGLLYTWHRLAREGELSLVPVPAAVEFVPVEIVPEAAMQRGRREMAVATPDGHRMMFAQPNRDH
jgi:transposase